MFDDDSFGLDLEDLKNDSFMNHLNSTLLVKRDYELHEYDYEWLEIIEETNIGECNSNYRYAMFVNKNGLHIPEKTSEDYLSFKIYNYETYTK